MLLVLAFAVLSINEFYNLMKRKGYVPNFVIGNFFTIFFIIFAYYALKRDWEPAQSAILTGAAILTFSSGIFFKKVEDAIPNIAVTLLGIFYIGWFFSYLIFIRALTDHGAYIFFLSLTIWANDITAYLIGSKFGRIKLSPYISPKKSVEGAVAGFIVCVGAAALFSTFMVEISLVDSLFLGVTLGIVAQISDLVESLIKRDAGVKDSSSIVPGHGGVLDRMDSFILTAPVMYYYISWVILR
jgi:phosphatidate cytidylyltransferase